MQAQVSEHFKVYELICKCGCGQLQIDTAALDKLEEMRALLKQPIRITSGYRCDAHNESVGGARHSQHVNGSAFDLAIVNSFQAYQFVNCALAVGFTGIGVHRDFIHVDTREEPRLWIY